MGAVARLHYRCCLRSSSAFARLYLPGWSEPRLLGCGITPQRRRRCTRPPSKSVRQCICHTPAEIQHTAIAIRPECLGEGLCRTDRKCIRYCAIESAVAHPRGWQRAVAAPTEQGPGGMEGMVPLGRPGSGMSFRRGKPCDTLSLVGSMMTLPQLLWSGDVRVLPNPFQQKLSLP